MKPLSVCLKADKERGFFIIKLLLIIMQYKVVTL